MADPLHEGDPAQIGPYTLHARLGGGGMGQVFLGISPGGYAVAVKVVRPELAADADFRRRFTTEVAAARKVGGLYTAHVVDAAPDAEPPWMATAHISGPSLHQAVGEHGPLPLESVAALGAGLAEGLTAVHAHGVVHRDLKPDNVLLAEDGPRLIDFGIARALDATSHTHSSTVLGTAAFMSPEQARARQVGAASDVFSLGCVLAFAATGASPFGDGPVHAVVFRIVYEEPDLSGLPAPLADLIANCLAKDPDTRPGLDRVLEALAPLSPTRQLRAGGWWPGGDGDLTETFAHHRTRLLTVARTKVDPDEAAADPLLFLIGLPGDRARVFALLGSAPGPDISTEAAAALAGIPAEAFSQAETALRDLATAGLLTEHPGGRWSLDTAFTERARALPVRFGADAGPEGEDLREKALDRLLDFYTTRAHAAVAYLRAKDDDAPTEEFAERSAALAWLDAERDNLIAAARTAHDTGRALAATSLTTALSEYLYTQGRFKDAIVVYTLARGSARQADDIQGEAWAWHSLGLTLDKVRRFEDAIDAFTCARDLYERLSDTYNEAWTCGGLGSALFEVRRFEEAVDAHTRARDLHQQLGDTRGEVHAWNNLGTALRGALRFGEAIDAYTSSRDILHRLGGLHEESLVWNNLGLALYDAHRFEEAIYAHSRARDLSHQSGDTQAEASGWNNLGSALSMTYRFEGAMDAHGRARDLYRALGDTRGEARAWNNLGNALRDALKLEEAMDAHGRARDLYRALGDTRGEALAWNNLGSTLREMYRFEEAIEALTLARDSYRQLGHTRSEASAWDDLGTVLSGVRRFEEAMDAHGRARDLHQQLGDTRGEARSWDGLGLVLLRSRRFDEAIDAHTRAGDLYRQLGDIPGEANARNNLGSALWKLRRFPEALDTHTRARDLFQQLGDTHGEAMAWTNLGLVLHGSDRFDEAENAFIRARDLSQQIGDTHGEALAWQCLGDTWRRTRRKDEASHAYAQAIRGYQAIGDTERLRDLKLFLILRWPQLRYWPS